jgi:hypothetical protein
MDNWHVCWHCEKQNKIPFLCVFALRACFAACFMNKQIFFSAASEDMFIHSLHIMHKVNVFRDNCVPLSISPKLLKEFWLNLISGGATYSTLVGSILAMWQQSLTPRRRILPQMLFAPLFVFMEPKGSVTCSQEPAAASCTHTTENNFRPINRSKIWFVASNIDLQHKCNFYFRSACYLPDAGFLLGVIFDPEDGGDIFLRNIGWLSTDYMALYPRR